MDPDQPSASRVIISRPMSTSDGESGELGESFVISVDELGVNGLWASVKQVHALNVE
jgi:hypothetical protein